MVIIAVSFIVVTTEKPDILTDRSHLNCAKLRVFASVKTFYKVKILRFNEPSDTANTTDTEYQAIINTIRERPPLLLHAQVKALSLIIGLSKVDRFAMEG